MKSEKQKMLGGELYSALDPELTAERQRCQTLCKQLNESSPAGRPEIIARLLGKPTDAYFQPPFFCDYGSNISIGRNFYCNANCVILDVLPVTFGDNVLLGPAVQIYTATHPIDANERRGGLEYGKPINIGSDVWIGGGATICPGVTIGDRSVIGAGSVVTRDVPPDVIAAGNPCRVLRSLHP